MMRTTVLQYTVAVAVLLCLATGQSGATTIDFTNLPNDPLANGEITGAAFNALGLDLTLSGLNFNVGCGLSGGPTCLGVDDTSVNDFNGRLIGTFVLPGTHIPALVSFLQISLCCESATRGTRIDIYDENSVQVSTIVGADVTFFSVPVAYFDIRFSTDAITSVTYANIQALPEPAGALLLACVLAAFAVNRSRRSPRIGV